MIRRALLLLFGACTSTHAMVEMPDAGVPAVPLATQNGGLGYTANVMIGNQSFVMQVDTGSTTVAVAGAACTTCTGISPLYAPGSDATDLGRMAMSTYGDTSTWTGEIYSDTVQLVGGPNGVPLDLAAITSQQGFFVDNSSQGILGLGAPDLEIAGTTSLIAQSMQAGLDPVLAFQLCSDRGTLWLGGFDPSAMTAPPQYAPMLPMDPTAPFVAVEVDDIGIGGASLGFGAAEIKPTLVDTGASIFVAPQPIVDALTTAVESSPGFHALFGTQTFAQNQGCLATLTPTTSAEVDAMLPALSLTLPSTTGGAFTLAMKPLDSYLLAVTGGYCLWVESVSDLDVTLLGPSMVRSLVTVIDLGAKQIGFAPEVGCQPF